MKSIRRQIVVGTLAGVVIVVIAVNGALFFYIRYALTAQFDEALLGKARAFVAFTDQSDTDFDGARVVVNELPDSVRATIAAHAEQGAAVEVERATHKGDVFYKVETTRNGVESEFLVSEAGEYQGPFNEFHFAFEDAAFLEFQPSPTAEYYQVWDEDGEVVAKSPSLEGAVLPLDSATTARDAVNIDLPDGRNGRAIVMTFTPRIGARSSSTSDEDLTLLMARSRMELDRSVRIVGAALAGASILMACCTVIIVRRSVDRGLRPLNAVADETASIDETQLDHRFSASTAPRELVPIVTQLNTLLDRLQAAFQREKRFTSDAAHELRTPISELRILADVGLKSAGENRELLSYFRDASAIADQMERLVNALLMLARAESGNQATTITDEDLARIVREVWTPFEAIARQKQIAVRLHLSDPSPLRTDRHLIGSILGNVFSNAVENTPNGGEIVVANSASPLMLQISNTNCQLEPADLEHLFEPFWRKDKARSNGNHSGVGLSLVCSLASILEIEVKADLPAPDRFRIELRF